MSRIILILLFLILLPGCVVKQTTRFSSDVLPPAMTMKIGASVDRLSAQTFNWVAGGRPGDFSVKFDAKVSSKKTYLETTREYKSWSTK